MKKAIRIICMIVLAAAGICIWEMTEGITMGAKRTFSQDELALLAANGTPQERIDRSALSDSEERLLSALAKAQAYLAQRYPQEKFCFTGMDNGQPRRGQILLIASSADTPQETFAVRVEDGTEPGRISESHFCDLKRVQLCTLVEGTIGFGVQCDLEIVGLYGDDYDPALPLEALNERGLTVSISGRAFAPADGAIQEKKAEMENALLDKGLRGGFTLCEVEEISAQEAMRMPAWDKSFVVRETYISLPANRGEVK